MFPIYSIKEINMIDKLAKMAYNDLIYNFWDDKINDFTFSENERICSPSITSVCLWAIREYEEEFSGNWLSDEKINIIHEKLTASFPWTDAGKHYKNVMAMSFGFLGLHKTKIENSLSLEVIEYLISQQNEDGGWFFNKEHGKNSNPYFTYWALKCFLSIDVQKEHWDKVINRAFVFLINQYPKNKINPTSYLMVKDSLYHTFNKYKEFMSSELVEEYKKLRDYKLDRLQYSNGSWHKEPAVISSAYFTKSLFTLKNLYFITNSNTLIVSDVNQKMINWIYDNHQEPGWSSDMEESQIGLSWTTAYLLLGLVSYKRALEKYIKS